MPINRRRVFENHSASTWEMGRHSCCYKQKLRKGLWSPEEDEKLYNHIMRFGVGCWSTIPKQAGEFSLSFSFPFSCFSSSSSSSSSFSSSSFSSSSSPSSSSSYSCVSNSKISFFTSFFARCLFYNRSSSLLSSSSSSSC